MENFKDISYPVFNLFNKRWALVTAGSIRDYNTCVIGWGEMGNIWNERSIITVFVHPDRYTSQFLKKYDYFTVSFYGQKYRPALAYLGSHSGRDEVKVTKCGLTPEVFDNGVTFREADISFLCRKLYFHQFSKDGLADDVKQYYASNPKEYPNVSPDGTNDDWEPHYVIMGQIVNITGQLSDL